MRGSAQRPLAFLPFLCFLVPFLPPKNIFSPLSLRKTSDHPIFPTSPTGPTSPRTSSREKKPPLFLFFDPPAPCSLSVMSRARSSGICRRGPPTRPTSPISPRTSKREDLRPVRQVRLVREHPKGKEKIEKLLSLYCQLKQEPNEVQRVSPKQLEPSDSSDQSDPSENTRH